MQHILDWSRKERLDRLVLHASDEGRALYKKLGFVLTNEMKFAGKVPGSDVVGGAGNLPRPTLSAVSN